MKADKIVANKKLWLKRTRVQELDSKLPLKRKEKLKKTRKNQAKRERRKRNKLLGKIMNKEIESKIMAEEQKEFKAEPSILVKKNKKQMRKAVNGHSNGDVTSNVSKAEPSTQAKKNKKRKRKAVKGHSNDSEKDLTGTPSGSSNAIEDEVDAPKNKKKEIINNEETSAPSNMTEDDVDTPKKEKKKVFKQKKEEENWDASADLEETKEDPLNDANEENTEEDSSQTKSHNKWWELSTEGKAKQEERTVFVGNVSVKANRKQLNRFFSIYGKVESVRLRSAAVAEQGMTKKECVIKGKFHENRSSLNAYIRFTNKEMVEKALKANGELFMDKHLRVDQAVRDKAKESRNRKTSVFVGNLNFGAEEEDLWSHFADCGKIESVRIVRNNKLGSGKGFGYINFESEDSVSAALSQHGKTFMDRELRVQRCFKKAKAKSKPTTTGNEKETKDPKALKLDFMKRKNKNKSSKKGNGKDDAKGKGEYTGKKVTETSKFKKAKKKRNESKKMKVKIALAQQLAGTDKKKKNEGKDE